MMLKYIINFKIFSPDPSLAFGNCNFLKHSKTSPNLETKDNQQSSV